MLAMAVRADSQTYKGTLITSHTRDNYVPGQAAAGSLPVKHRSPY